MPHRCMECGNIVESGELDLSAGCPVCGSRKFQYLRPSKKEAPEAKRLTVAEYVARAGAAEAEENAARQRKEAPKRKHSKAGPGLEVTVGMQPEAKPAEHKAKDKKPAHERIESVRIVEKGSYDLNLPVLLNRKELVMSREDGVYVVDLPSALKAPGEKKRRKRRK